MGMFYIYRVFRKKARCVYGRVFTHNSGPFPEALDYLLRRQVIITKEWSPRVAKLMQPFSDDIAKMLEAYPESYHHAAQQEIGIGLALSPEKWENGWPNIAFEELTFLTDLEQSPEESNWDWATINHEWTIQQLMDQRQSGKQMPRGMDKEAWRILGVQCKAKPVEGEFRTN
jgi:hypothetical protein